MKSELTDDFLFCFKKLPAKIKSLARKNYTLWKSNHNHPSLDFKRIQGSENIFSIRIGIGWRALGIKKNPDTIVWFWAGSHSEYNEMLKKL